MNKKYRLLNEDNPNDLSRIDEYAAYIDLFIKIGK